MAERNLHRKQAVNSFSERFYLAYTANCKERLKNKQYSYRFSKSWELNGFIFWNILLFKISTTQNHLKIILHVTILMWQLSPEWPFMNSYFNLLRWSAIRHKWGKSRKIYLLIYPNSHIALFIAELITKLQCLPLSSHVEPIWFTVIAFSLIFLYLKYLTVN